MKTRFHGMTMVAAALASMTMVSACDTGGDSTSSALPLQDPTSTFIVDENNGAGDTTKACPNRADWTTTASLGNGLWGSWQACYSLCPAGSFAYAATLRTEVGQGAGDDSAMNGIQFDCYNSSTGVYAGSVTSHAGFWGTWGTRAVTNPYTVANPFVTGQLKFEGSKGFDDDTAANAVVLYSLNGTQSTPSANTGFGSWQPVRGCPAGTAICGVNTRVEGSQGAGDDTALNGIALACCSF